MEIWGLSGNYPAILHISRTGRVALMYLGSQSEKTLLYISEQPLSRGASQSAVRRRWRSLCTLWPSHSQIVSLSMAISALGKARSRREPNLGCRGTDRPGWSDPLPPPPPPKKNTHENCRMCRRTDADSLICSLGHYERDVHTVHKLSQRSLTADWLALWKSDCSWTHSKVSSNWMPRHIKVMRPVIEIFRIAGYFPDSRGLPLKHLYLLYVKRHTTPHPS